jgi:hypothetical protein
MVVSSSWTHSVSLMRPAPGEWDCLRLAAKAADREKAGEILRRVLEPRLTELGYSPLAIAHAFSALTGPATVEEALAELKENERLERIVPVALDFGIVERELALPPGHSVTITGVERDGRGVRIAYEIRPSASRQVDLPRAVARDDLDREYACNGGGFIGVIDDRVTGGGFTMPLPGPDARLLRLRMSWSKEFTSLWERPALELRIAL